jgi:hypothetical protein
VPTMIARLYAFDLLELDGEDWRPRPLDERKAKLEHLLARVRAGIRFNEHMAGDGAMIFAHACQMGFEGIVSKHRLRAYRSGPSKVWLKIKNPSACCASKTGLDMSDQIIRAVLYCDYRAADAEHPEERDQFLSLAQEYRKLAAREATRLAFEMPKRPAAPSLRRDAAARRRA